MTTCNGPAKRWPLVMVLLSMLLLLNSMTGCASRLVVIDGTETVVVKKATLDRLYADNEALLASLAQCREAR